MLLVTILVGEVSGLANAGGARKSRPLSAMVFVLCTVFSWPTVQAKTYTIGFSQSDTAESDWRKANTSSFLDAAKELGIRLIYKDAGGKTDVQRRHVEDFIRQKVDAIVLSAHEINGWDAVLRKARSAKIPVILSDRTLALKPENQKAGLYVTWIGSDFRYQGRVAAAWLAQQTAGRCNIVEIEGPPDAAPAIERAKGFREVVALFPSMKIIATQTGLWRADRAEEVMHGLLRAEGRNICAVFAHNDNMAFGAVAAIEGSEGLGLKPGKDILVMGVDGVRRGFEYLVAGKINALVESNPLLGKYVLKVTVDVLSGRNVPPRMFVEDGVYTVYNAAAAQPTRKY